MKILVLSQVFPPARGGSGRWLFELYRRLTGFQVMVVAGHAPDDGPFDAAASLRIERMNLQFASWGVSSVRSAAQYVRAFIKLRSVLTRTRPDVIHCGKCLPEGLLAVAIKRWKGVPFVCFVHGEELTLAEASRELRRLTRAVLRESALIVANSQHTRKMLGERWSVVPDRIAVMHPGVDTTRFTPAPRDAVARARLGWTGRRVVLTVGALQRRKGQDMMIRALPVIRQHCPDVLYAIVGEGWERPYLESLVAELGVEHLVQFRATPADDELIECYQQCDLFALPNRQVGWDFEGFGIVLLEAQACGKPVVAGRSGGTVETMNPSQTGELIGCDTPDDLGATVVRLLDAAQTRDQLGSQAREWVCEHFDWTVLTEKARSAFERPSVLLTDLRSIEGPIR